MLVTADRRNRDAAYQAHRWFARRPPSLLRALLLAATSDATIDDDTFWQDYGSDAPTLQGLTVLDPFMGGGTTLVEAGRLGADVVGCDIDPVAVRLVQHELHPPAAADLATAATDLLHHLRDRCSDFYPSTGDTLPLHTFSLATVTCPDCHQTGELYRSLILARGASKVGSVARPDGTTVFCPICFALVQRGVDAKVLDHCGRRLSLEAGNYSGYHYTCPHCLRRSTHGELRTGAQPRRQIAVEQTHAEGPRTFRLPTPSELTVHRRAEAYLRSHDLRLPAGKVPADNKEGRPGSLGLETFPDLFTARQLALFGTAFAWIDTHQHDPALQRALLLAVSNALATNNRLCGYATDYGRLAALFSVRGYSLPALAVELNALHPTGGRGTLPRTLDRVIDSVTTTTRRRTLTGQPQAPLGRDQSPTATYETSATRDIATHRHPSRSLVLLGSAPTALEAFDAQASLTVQPRFAPSDTPTLVKAAGRTPPPTPGADGSGPGLRGDNACPQDVSDTATGLIDVVVTDPPYFDYIAYDTLSAFYRSWSPDDHLEGDPVLPAGADPVAHFATGLADVLSASRDRLRPDGLLTLTYHSLNPDAWRALASALKQAQLRVTALWPVLADPHMGHHGTSGAIQYDLVVVARPHAATLPAGPPQPFASAWLSWLGLEDLGEADRHTCQLAYQHLHPLWGRPKHITSIPAAPRRLTPPSTPATGSRARNPIKPA